MSGASREGPVTLTILSGATDSAALSTVLTNGATRVALGSAVGLVFYGPAALTGTATLQVVGTDGGTNWLTLQNPPGTDVALAAAKATFVPCGGFCDLRIHSGSAEGADRAFLITFQVAM